MNLERCAEPAILASLHARAFDEAWDAAAFQSWLVEVEPDSEEERQQGSYDVRPHPQRNVGAQAWAVGDWRLELRRQEQIWWINHGPMGLPSDGDGDSSGTRPEGFRMCQIRLVGIVQVNPTEEGLATVDFTEPGESGIDN